MHWILQENLFKEKEWTNLVSSLERIGSPYSVHKVVPFVGELIPEPQLDTKNVICMGSYSMRHVAKKMNWVPGVYDLFEKTFVVQREHWGEHMLNFSSKVCEFKDIVFEDIAFLRPINDSKTFAGKVFDWKEFSEWQDLICTKGVDYGCSLTPQDLIQVSEPHEIYAEYRYWVVNGEIVTRSLYKRGRTVFYSPDVDERFDLFVKDRIGEWLPDKAFVIDVCDTPDGIKIVEINTINSAGFYAADMMKLVSALNGG